MTGPEVPDYNVVAITLPEAEPRVEVCRDFRGVAGPPVTIMANVQILRW